MKELLELLTSEKYRAVPMAKGAGLFTIEWDKFPLAFLAFFAWHGMKQILGDTGANLSVKTEIVAAATKKYDALIAGDLRTQSERVVDEEEKIARQAVMQDLQSNRPKGSKPLEPKALLEETKKVLADSITGPIWYEFAKEQIAARQKTAESVKDKVAAAIAAKLAAAAQ